MATNETGPLTQVATPEEKADPNFLEAMLKTPAYTGPEPLPVIPSGVAASAAAEEAPRPTSPAVEVAPENIAPAPEPEVKGPSEREARKKLADQLREERVNKKLSDLQGQQLAKQREQLKKHEQRLQEAEASLEERKQKNAAKKAQAKEAAKQSTAEKKKKTPEVRKQTTEAEAELKQVHHEFKELSHQHSKERRIADIHALVEQREALIAATPRGSDEKLRLVRELAEQIRGEHKILENIADRRGKYEVTLAELKEYEIDPDSDERKIQAMKRTVEGFASEIRTLRGTKPFEKLTPVSPSPQKAFVKAFADAGIQIGAEATATSDQPEIEVTLEDDEPPAETTSTTAVAEDTRGALPIEDDVVKGQVEARTAADAELDAPPSVEASFAFSEPGTTDEQVPAAVTSQAEAPAAVTEAGPVADTTSGPEPITMAPPVEAPVVAPTPDTARILQERVVETGPATVVKKNKLPGRSPVRPGTPPTGVRKPGIAPRPTQPAASKSRPATPPQGTPKPQVSDPHAEVPTFKRIARGFGAYMAQIALGQGMDSASHAYDESMKKSAAAEAQKKAGTPGAQSNTK